ncbi:MAG: hypothetical protein GW795_08365 [Cyanobacteria bacterium]|nr:hypothetical protein [Cyanobacteria bacterium CG_2015-16_32_12]NCO77596.1 hypothetical protein [Cyanobacteria bacterium CG_2015-22_32_23]NCQ03120.1 hypothetical protein [Cyanobacteria bacterium CG_2015-09_32_10]NCQ41888.1 hypothetical protein [Cyanobacteria bacterium CG_2015-04_32_10]NCS83442.1 hypothetical protein [Cyanobacteria bacterium CG_2015-02_32_10]
MFKSHKFLTVFSLSFLTFSPFFIAEKTIAQSTQSPFNSQQCIQGLTKEGLKPQQASVWCNYKQECLVRSQKEGLPAEAAKSVCDCSIKEFRKRYSTEKFKELTRQINSNAKVASQLREVGESCFEDILFE